MNITVFGNGYVGLVTAACLAESGNHVYCVSRNEEKIARLKDGDIPIYEPGLAPIVQQNLKARRLVFTTDAPAGVDHGEAIFIAVGTPPQDDGSADLGQVEAVARSIGDHLTKHTVIVNKSTVPIGTADHVRSIIQERLDARGSDVTFDVISNPEFLKEGAAVADFMKPDRIVVGAEDPHSIDLMRELYAPFNRNHNRIIIMDVRSAELTKYASNAMLATKISFMNEMANIAERVGANVENVRVGIGSDSRIGFNFIYPGIGYGGACFPKDIRALKYTAGQFGYDAELIGAVESVNERQKDVLLDKILSYFGGDVRGRTFAMWGLAFKPNTDDMREAPSRRLINGLLGLGATVQAYDPEAMDSARAIFGEQEQLRLCETRDEAVVGADALVIATEWREFQSPDFELLRAELKQPLIFDGRNIYDTERIAQEGFQYFGIGLGDADHQPQDGQVTLASTTDRVIAD